MTDPAIIEAAAQVLFDRQDEFYTEFQQQLARAVIAAVTPLILEQAAKVAEDYTADPEEGIEIAAVIRALKERP